jgi:hypothetical protein
MRTPGATKPSDLGAEHAPSVIGAPARVAVTRIAFGAGAVLVQSTVAAGLRPSPVHCVR